MAKYSKHYVTLIKSGITVTMSEYLLLVDLWLANICKIRAVRRLWTAVLFLCFSYGAMVWVYLGD